MPDVSLLGLGIRGTPNPLRLRGNLTLCSPLSETSVAHTGTPLLLTILL